MPGPAPKDPSLRARRNKTATAARLTSIDAADVEVPELMPRVVENDDGEQQETTWHPQALQLWEDVWTSPMAGEYLDADVHGLYVLVALTDAYWRRLEAGQVSGAAELAKELRLQRQAYGLTPIDRRRLQWEVDRGDEAAQRHRRRAGNGSAPRQSSTDDGADPRLVLVS